MTLIPNWHILTDPPPALKADPILAVLKANYRCITNAQRLQNWTDVVYWQTRFVKVAHKNQKLLKSVGFLVHRERVRRELPAD